MGRKVVGLRRQRGRCHGGDERAPYPGPGEHTPEAASELGLPHLGTHPRFLIQGVLLLRGGLCGAGFSTGISCLMFYVYCMTYAR
jgi:hypothetical protein